MHVPQNGYNSVSIPVVNPQRFEPIDFMAHAHEKLCQDDEGDSSYLAHTQQRA